MIIGPYGNPITVGGFGEFGHKVIGSIVGFFTGLFFITIGFIFIGFILAFVGGMVYSKFMISRLDNKLITQYREVGLDFFNLEDRELIIEMAEGRGGDLYLKYGETIDK